MADSSRSVLPLAVAMALGCMVGVILTTALREKAPRQRATAPPSSSRELRDVVERLVVAVRDLRDRERATGEPAARGADGAAAPATTDASSPSLAASAPLTAAVPPALRALAAEPPATASRDELTAVAADRLSPIDGFKKFAFMTAGDLLRRYGPPDTHSASAGQVLWGYRIERGDGYNTIRFTMLNWIVVRTDRY